MPDRRKFIAGVALLAAARVTRGQEPAKLPRVGLLVLGSRSSWEHVIKLFRQRLRELGYVEGRNIHLEERYTDNSPQRLAELARELSAARVDVIVAVAVAATRAAREATQTIPIVMVHGAYAPGIYEALSRPGGSVTGTISMSSDLAAKHLEILHELFPRAARVAILANLENPGGKAFVENALPVARRLGGIARLVNVCGVGVAMEMLLTAEPIDAQRALQINLVSKVVPHDELMAAARHTAKTILRNDQAAIRSAKQVILDIIGRNLDDQLYKECIAAYTLMANNSTVPGLLAKFYEKTDRGRHGVSKTDL